MTTTLTGGRYFDGTGTPIVRGDITFDDGRLTHVGDALPTPEAGASDPRGEVIDVTGCTVVPGFIDTHVHVLIKGFDLLENLNLPYSYQYYIGAKNLERLLDIGITTVRDASGADLGTKRAIQDGLIDGPELQIAIIALSQTAGHGDFLLNSGADSRPFAVTPNRPSAIIDGPEEARKRVRELVRNGADAIKINTSGGVISPKSDPATAHLSPEEIEMIVREATRAGIPVMAHSHGNEAIKNSLRAGVSSIEHGTWLDDEAIEMMLERGTWHIPTLMASHAIIEQLDAGMQMAPGIAEKARRGAAARDISFDKSAAAGVKIAFGSDCVGTSNGNNLTELRLLSRGLGSLGALKAATSSAAEVLGIDQRVGTLSAGYDADLVVISGDASDLTNLENRIQLVIKRGRIVRDFRTVSAA
jgi:imidazolonepropionase-like amidohydrolase